MHKQLPSKPFINKDLLNIHLAYLSNPWVKLFITWCLLVFIYPMTGLDEIITNMYFDGHIFYLKHDAFLVGVMHDGLKTVVMSIALIIALLWALSFKMPALIAIRAPLLWTLVGMIASTLTVLIIKNLSVHSCPDKLTLYHGTKPYFSLINTFTNSALAGHCWPGGHASAGISLLALYVAFKHTHATFAHISLVISVLLWFLMGWAQIMRGLHFLSHNLWTAWIVCGVLMLQHALWSPYTVTETHEHA
jgi:membrane-associated PAP2 superfamily phosphatase